MLDFRELEYQTAKQEDSYEVEKKTSLEYLMEALHISKGKTKLGDLEDWYRIQKSMISDEVSSDSMLVISREIFSESLTSKYSEKEVSKDEEDQEKGDQEDEVKESAADVSVKCVVFKDVSPIIYLEPIEDLVETPCDESEVSYLDSIQNLDQLAALVTVATFKSALAMLGSSSEERIMSDLASEPCLSKLNTFHFSITADKLNKKRTFDVLEDDEEAENKTGSKDANQEETTLPSNLEEDITPSENLEDVTPSTNLQQDVTPSNNVETPSNNLEQDVTPSNNLEQDVTPSNNLEQDVTPSNNLEQDVTPPNNLEQDVTPPNNVETPSSNLEDVTPSNNLEQDVTPLNNVETPSNNLEQDVTPSKNMEENPIPLNHVQENVLPQLDETDGTSSYSLGKAKTEPNIHMKHPVKRSSLPIDATSSEILGNIYSQSDLEEEPSWEDIIPEENESDAMNAEPLGTYTMETHEDFSNFYNFLKGTTGEKYWNLWVNVDRIKLMKTDIQKQM
ncbi:uncharacterized protein LOC106869931 [Octopus bimaculoides]|uniref:Uncharacterized protein n=1 Tax=Octopus bimaculoides TaxID=37653 RepID=A0A0L8HMR2_OCTBM|nr:uncharacterized protein LOC106869931 [Octopus bimaculoides]|eukprot:XP_014771354.1 PREDICTED: uncharacterized protein LOC106869931 [Octopus bimaculoides]